MSYLEALEMYLWYGTSLVRESQMRSLLRPCRLGKIEGCFACQAKQWLLRKRYK